MSFSKPVVLTVPEWIPNSIKFMPPKINDKGGKSINIISMQTKRGLHISSPLMMTWGIADFVDEKGEADGKFSMSLNFPNEEYCTKSTTDFLEKLKEFENHMLDMAVENSELWWGEKMSRELVKHTFFPMLKYQKNKETKKFDYTKPPSIRAKVPVYKDKVTGVDKWCVEIYDTKSNLLFPNESEEYSTPIDFVQKLSSVACVLQCGGVWIGGKGWGVTWKLVQCVVKPREVVSVFGKCHIQLSPEDQTAMECQDTNAEVEEESTFASSFKQAMTTNAISTLVPSDNEEEESSIMIVQPTEQVQEQIQEQVQEQIQVPVSPEPLPMVQESVPIVKKKIIRKKPTAV